METTLLFFYGTIIFAITTAGVAVYSTALFKESKESRINHSNFGSD